MTLHDQQQALNRIAIVMPSCDRYASLWPLSLGAIDRWWPGRPRDVYVVANHRPCTVPGVQPVLVGDDVSWSDNFIAALQQVPHDYVFMALDDLVMVPDVDAPRMNAALARAVADGWDYLRVNPLPAPSAAGPDGLGLCLPGEAYRSATVWSLWRKSVLLQVLKPGENAWQFEKLGSARTDRFGQWWASAQRNVPYVNVITAGRADPMALRQLSSLGLDVSGIDFPTMNARELLTLRWRLLRSKGLALVPRGLRRKVLNLLAPS